MPEWKFVTSFVNPFIHILELNFTPLKIVVSLELMMNSNVAIIRVNSRVTLPFKNKSIHILV